MNLSYQKSCTLLYSSDPPIRIVANFPLRYLYCEGSLNGTRTHLPISPRTFFWVSTPAPHLSQEVLWLHVLSYVPLRISLAAVGLVWLVWSYRIAYVLWYIYISYSMLYYILASLPWVSCGWYVLVLFHAYHNLQLSWIIIHILYYVLLHIGLDVMSLVLLECFCIIPYVS